jgi:hypothetical protein
MIVIGRLNIKSSDKMPECALLLSQCETTIDKGGVKLMGYILLRLCKLFEVRIHITICSPRLDILILPAQ